MNEKDILRAENGRLRNVNARLVQFTLRIIDQYAASQRALLVGCPDYSDDASRDLDQEIKRLRRDLTRLSRIESD